MLRDEVKKRKVPPQFPLPIHSTFPSNITKTILHVSDQFLSENYNLTEGKINNNMQKLPFTSFHLMNFQLKMKYFTKSVQILKRFQKK